MVNLIMKWLLANAALVTNIVLAILTGLYVILTYKLVNQSKIANEINRKTLIEQTRILTAPYIHCEIKRSGHRMYVALTNGGSAPAYDVDVWIAGNFDMDDLKICPSVKNLAETIPNENNDAYGIDRVIYPVFFHGKRVTARLTFPMVTDSVTVIVQYRDASGNNYSYRAWFIDDTDGERKSYQLANINPIGNVLSARVDFHYKIRTFNNEKPPEHIVDFYNRYIHHRCFFEVELRDCVVEDRGEWDNVR